MEDVTIATALLVAVSAGAARAAFHGLIYADDAAFALCRRWSMFAAFTALVWLALPDGGGVEPQWAAIAAIGALDCRLISRGWCPRRLPRAKVRVRS